MSSLRVLGNEDQGERNRRVRGCRAKGGKNKQNKISKSTSESRSGIKHKCINQHERESSLDSSSTLLLIDSYICDGNSSDAIMYGSKT